MITKLPKWVWLGGAVLAFSAGIINVIAILGFAHKAATHVTGIFSLFSIAVFENDRQGIVQTCLIIVSFFTGALIAGLIVGDGHLKMGRRYGVALALESVFLLLSAYGFIKGHTAGEYFACMAAGLQNAMVSTYSGAMVRTTHLTGTLSDLGSLVGNKLRRIPVDNKLIQLQLIITLSFSFGGLLGAVSYHYFGAAAMLLPALIIGASSIAYEGFRKNASGKKNAASANLAISSSIR